MRFTDQWSLSWKRARTSPTMYQKSAQLSTVVGSSVWTVYLGSDYSLVFLPRSIIYFFANMVYSVYSHNMRETRCHLAPPSWTRSTTWKASILLPFQSSVSFYFFIKPELIRNWAVSPEKTLQLKKIVRSVVEFYDSLRANTVMCPQNFLDPPEL